MLLDNSYSKTTSKNLVWVVHARYLRTTKNARVIPCKSAPLSSTAVRFCCLRQWILEVIRNRYELMFKLNYQYYSCTEKISPTNAVCTICSKVTYVFSTGIILTSMNTWNSSGRGWLGQNLGLALVAKTCPHRPQAFSKVNHGQALP